MDRNQPITTYKRDLLNPTWMVRLSVEGGEKCKRYLYYIVFYCKARQSLEKKLLVDDKITAYVKQIRPLGVI